MKKVRFDIAPAHGQNSKVERDTKHQRECSVVGHELPLLKMIKYPIYMVMLEVSKPM